MIRERSRQQYNFKYIFETTFPAQIVSYLRKYRPSQADLSKATFKNLEKPWQRISIGLDLASNVKRNDSASQNIQVKTETEPIYYMQNVDLIVLFFLE